LGHGGGLKERRRRAGHSGTRVLKYGLGVCHFHLFMALSTFGSQACDIRPIINSALLARGCYFIYNGRPLSVSAHRPSAKTRKLKRKYAELWDKSYFTRDQDDVTLRSPSAPQSHFPALNVDCRRIRAQPTHSVRKKQTNFQRPWPVSALNKRIMR
jgi:hypothetical protein